MEEEDMISDEKIEQTTGIWFWICKAWSTRNIRRESQICKSTAECFWIAGDDGHLHTWGRGFGGAPDACCPNRVNSLLAFTQATLGWNHALILTDEGEVLMLGSH